MSWAGPTTGMPRRQPGGDAKRVLAADDSPGRRPRRARHVVRDTLTPERRGVSGTVRPSTSEDLPSSGKRPAQRPLERHRVFKRPSPPARNQGINPVLLNTLAYHRAETAFSTRAVAAPGKDPNSA